MNDNQTDARLVQAYLAGKDSAFEKLYSRYERPLFSYVLKFSKDKQIAEDVFQQTWLKAIKGLPGYQEKAKFSSWLFGIAHNCSIDQIRKVSNKRETAHPEQIDRMENNQPAPDRVLEHSEEMAMLESAVAELPDEQREVVLMRIHGEVPFKEIAQIMECSLNTVLGRMHYAVKNLKRIMNDKIGEDLQNVLS